MAEGKNKILVYKDWESTFSKLSDEEAGRLIKHFFAYVNDENPEAPDRLTEIVFEPIKQTLKRDLAKWEEKTGEKSDSGRLGNLKRWNEDLYNKVVSKEITIEEAEEIAKHRKVSHSDEKDRGATENIANVAVSVSVTDSVSNNTPIGVSVEKIDWGKLIEIFNGIFSNRKSRIINDATKAKYRARLKDGWKKHEIQNAMLVVSKDAWHKETDFKHVTLEYFSRDATLQKYANRNANQLPRDIQPKTLDY